MKQAVVAVCFVLLAASLASPAEHTQRIRTFAGQIISRGGKYILQDAAGKQTWRLDRQDKARTFAGQQVTVSGTYSSADKTVHVRNIEAVGRPSDGRSRAIPPEVAHPDPTGPITPPTFPSQRPHNPKEAYPVKPKDPTRPTTTKPLG